MLEVLARKCGDFSQAALSSEQRRGLTGQKIYLKKKGEVQDKVVLLIDDVMTTGTTMRRCGEVLSDGCPTKIYGLTFCRAIK